MQNDAQNRAETISRELAVLYPDYTERLKKNRDPRKLDWELCNQGAISEADLIAVYSKASGLEVRDEDEIRDREVQAFPGISTDFLMNWACLPLSWTDDEMELLVSEPYSLSKMAYFMKSLFGRKAKFSLSRRSLLERKISTVYEKSPAEQEKSSNQFLQSGDSEEALRSLASEAAIVRLVNETFTRAIESEASDIHIEPEESRLVIRFRIDGLLHLILTTPLSQYPAIVSRIKLIGGLNIAERRLPQDGRTNLKIGRYDVDVRISTIPTMNGESVVLRLLRKDAMNYDLKNIGMSENMRREFERIATLPYGIILVVGPTGSGKTTTLYSTMTILNTLERKIITIEDPVEYRVSGLSQMQVNPKIGLDFANGLRHIVRQDPDVILVGEIRDRETAEIAIHASLTGHLVLSTLHTNDAAGAVSRLLDIGVEGFLISSSLKAVLSQRLIRKICHKCQGKGAEGEVRCKACSGTGFKGRTGIYELLVINDEIASAISKSCDSATVLSLAVKNGMKTILEDGREKVEAGITTASEIARVTINV